MNSWYFSEQSYYPAWDHDVTPKVTSPSSLVDPEIAHRLMPSLDLAVPLDLEEKVGTNWGALE